MCDDVGLVESGQELQRENMKLVIQKINKKQSDKNKLRKKAYFICEEHCVVKGLNPHVLVRSPHSSVIMLSFIHCIERQMW